MRSTRALAPHDPRLNDLRWLIGEALRRLHRRADLDALRAAPLDRVGGAAAPGPRSGLPASEIALHARDKLRAAAALAGPAAWPVLTRVVIEGASLRDCRRLVPEIVTPWRADAVLADRLRVGARSAGRGGRGDGGEKVRRRADGRGPLSVHPQFSPVRLDSQRCGGLSRRLKMVNRVLVGGFAAALAGAAMLARPPWPLALPLLMACTRSLPVRGEWVGRRRASGARVYVQPESGRRPVISSRWRRQRRLTW